MFSAGVHGTSIPTCDEPVGNENPWYAVRVKYRFEASVSSHLRENGYETLVPLYSARRRWSDRMKTVSTPLFPGYVFCQFDSGSLRPVHSVPGVTGIVSFGRKLAEVDATELSALRSVLNARMLTRPWPFLQVGRKVQLDRGPLRGLVGIVIRDKDWDRLILSVTLLNSSVAVEIDREWISPID